MPHDLLAFPRVHAQNCRCPRCQPWSGGRLSEQVHTPAPTALQRQAARLRRAGVKRLDILVMAAGFSASSVACGLIFIVQRAPAIAAALGF